ncbi:MAG: restriction endonuclease subunit S [Candidatus Diapherotrites archaeon]|nr:restriction endonuclease subunit S [Candidatus Diapherotrites archaeon]
METEMPEDWELKELSEVAEVVTGSTPSTEIKKYYGDQYPWVRPPELGSRAPIVKTNVKLSKEGAKKARLVPKGAVLVCCIGSIGKMGIAGVELATNQQINSVVFDEKQINPKFGYYYLLSVSDKIEQLGSETTIKIVNKSRFSTIKIAKPPLPIQEKIVTKLDAFFEKYEEMKKENKNIKQRQSKILQNSIESLIPKDNLSNDWEKNELVNVCTKVTDGAHFSPKYVPSGVPFATISNVKEEAIDFSSCKFISKADFEKLKKNDCNPLRGDVLFSKDGTVGKVIQIDYDRDFIVLSSLAIIRPKKQILTKYLKYYLKSDFALKRAIGFKTGTAITRVILRNLKRLPVIYPKSIKKQEEMVEKFNLIEKKMNELLGQQKGIDANLNSLPKAVLAKAFSGKLC